MTRRQPTQPEIAHINAILRGVTFIHGQEVTWGGRRPEAVALCRELSGYKPKGNCLSCETRMLNILAEAVGLPPFAHEVAPESAATRMALCVVCPAFHENTESCGRLILDAISPEPVSVGGRLIEPCGCYMPIKTRFKAAHCPASKW